MGRDKLDQIWEDPETSGTGKGGRSAEPYLVKLRLRYVARSLPCLTQVAAALRRVDPGDAAGT